LDLISQKRIPAGIFVSSTDPQTTDIAAAAGFDFVVIDREPGPHDNASALGHIRAAEGRGIIPIIRVLENSKTLIQASLDLGAHGVIVPKIETAEGAKAAVNASLYAPAGFRGMCNGCYAANYGLLQDWPDHMHSSDNNVLMIPLIETKRAVERIEEIADVPGVDFIFFGPGDLSNDMGINLLTEGEKLQPAWRKVRDAVHARGKYLISVGFLGFADDADIFAGEMDLLMLHVTMAGKIQAHRATEMKRFETKAA